MTSAVPALRSSLPLPSVRRVATAPFRLRTYGNLTYLGLAFPLGLAEFLLVVIGLSLSGGLSVILIGIPMFVAVLGVAVVLAAGERVLATYLLGVDLDPFDWPVTDSDGVIAGVKALVFDLSVWLAVVFLLSRLAIGVAAFTLLLTLLIPAAVLIATPLYYRTPGVDVGIFLGESITRELSVYVPWNELLVGVSFVVRLTSWEVSTLPGALAMSGLGLIALWLAINVLNAVAWLCGQWTQLLLGPETPTRLRELV